MAKAIVIRTSGEIEPVDFDLDDSYNTLKDAVGGYIECVHLGSFKADMWLNEEGKLIGLAPNALATLLWSKEYGQTDIMVGDVILTGGADSNGNTKGLTDSQASAVTDFLNGMMGAMSGFVTPTLDTWRLPSSK